MWELIDLKFQIERLKIGIFASTQTMLNQCNKRVVQSAF